MHWLILTPEYPPGSGGVGDYTRLVARGLAHLGDRVSVATAPMSERPALDPDIDVLELPDEFGAKSRHALGRAFRSLPTNAVVLVQYVPTGFGWRGMNLPFATWLGSRRERVWLMIHEAIFPFAPRQALRRDVLAGVSRAGLRLVSRRAERAFVSTPAWERFVLDWARPGLPLEWLPIPATMSGLTEAAPVGERGHVRPRVAHFGTYGELVRPVLESILLSLVERNPDLDLLLIGRGSSLFGERLAAQLPRGSSGVRSTGELDAESVSRLLRDADVALFPFGEGASTRRTSLMSALAAGAAIVTTQGWCSESFWRSSRAVELCEAEDVPGAVRAVERLLHDEALRTDLRRRARSLYDRRFHVERVVSRLRELHAGRSVGADEHALKHPTA